MHRWLRSLLLIALSALLVAAAAAVVFQARPAPGRPVPLPVAADEREIAWLNPATGAAAWERLVAAAGQVAGRLRGAGWEAEIGPAAFPRQTLAVPEFAVRGPGGRLVFRWYKLTSDWKPGDWVEALVARRPPPVAFVGGASSDAARELAGQLATHTAALAERDRPLLLLTTATADRVPGDSTPADDDDTAGVALNAIYPGRTFRFCFTNRQMALAVTQFLWGRDDLRPDADPVHMARWEDDSYSRDLIDGFWEALRTLVACETAVEWAWAAGCVAGPGPLAGGVMPLARAGKAGSGFRMARLPTPQAIDSSVGGFYEPNRFEAQAARYLLADLDRCDHQRRPLLIVTGQSAPCRRFLRAVARGAPLLAHRLVVATGDALAFNTIYRDRRLAWPVQDLPFPLVLFCHHNPTDAAAGFRPEGGRDGERDGPATTGTEDLLLYGSIVEALAVSAARDGRPMAGPGDLAERFVALRFADDRPGFGAGPPLFTPDGNRGTGTGEHVVCLRPHFQGTRVLPEATIEVWAWRAGASPAWQRVGEPLAVSYDDAPIELGGAP